MRPGREVLSEDLLDLTKNAVLSRGLGRAYGDAALPPPDRLDVATTILADRMLGFDESTGVLRAEAGVSLEDLNDVFLSRRYFTPVTPGTEFVTLGGMVAADVHGKNHHVEGTFGRHVRSLRLRVADGSVVSCSPEAEPELFWATVGGMGLTGHILEVEVAMRRIPSPWIYEERERCRSLEALLAGLEQASETWPFTVGWLDCLGARRGILIRGRWAEADEAPSGAPERGGAVDVPFVFPNWVLNPVSMRAFNRATYRLRGGAHGTTSPFEFFYPLDRVRNWNRIYGSRGFIQYQCVVPNADAAERFFQAVDASGASVYLCVVKDCADEGRGLLSFPRPGVSVALDLAVNGQTQSIVDALNEVVIDLGGRIYLAKDAFTRPDHFRAMEPRLDAWSQVRKRWDPGLTIRSAQSVRIFGDPA